MNRRRTSSVLVVCALAVGLVAAACTPPPPPPVENWNFNSTQVQVVSQTEFFETPIFGCGAITSNCYDEPYVINLWFRAKFGVPGSAQAGHVDTDGCSPEIALRSPNSTGLSGCSAGNVNFDNVQMLDLLDINDTNKLEILGVWQWGMEEDQLGIDVGGIASALQKVLNDTVASGQAPPSEGLVSFIINTLFSGGFVTTLTTALGVLGINIPVLGDDALGSKLFVAVNARGGLSDLIGNSTTPGNISIGFGLPSISSISIAGLGNSPVPFNNVQYAGAGGDHRYWNQWVRD